MNIYLGNKKLDYSKVHIVLEAGPTHTGLKSAKDLVDIAVEAGADSIKFQQMDAERIMADKNILFEYTYLKKTSNGLKYVPFKEPLYDILKRRKLTYNEWGELKRYCDKKDIHMFTTACYKDEVDFFVDKLKMDSIKVNSSDISQLDLIRHIARKGVNIQLDTGSSELWEIERAICCIEDEGNKNIIIHHCPSGYPAHLESIHLKMIHTLKTMFPNYLVAFSDHSAGWEMDIAAVSLGAGMIEKTITKDRFIKSCEHSFSIEKEEIKIFVKAIRNLEIALGEKRRTIAPEVREKRVVTRRSPYAIRRIEKGEIIKAKDFEFKRPGKGVSEDEFKILLGRKTLKVILKNEFLTNE